MLELIGSKRRLPTIAKNEWDEALHAFATDLDEQALYQAFVMNPP